MYTLKNAGLKNNSTLTTPLGHYRKENVLGWFDPSAGFRHLTHIVGSFI